MLRLALESLICQETNGTFSYEVLVIDDASTDDTRSVVSKFSQSSRVPIRYVLAEGKGIAWARNRGLQESCSGWVAFFDDDQLAEPTWLKELLACASEMKTGCVGGKRLLRLSEQHIASLSRTCRKLLGEMDLGNKPKKCGRKEFPAAGNVLLKRSVFDTVGQFDESLTRGGEDTDFTRRMQKAGLEAWYTPRAIAYHIIASYRFEESYLFWASLRVGDNYAHRDFLKGGLPKTTFACIARIGQAILISLPHLLWAYLSGNSGEVLGQKCMLRRALGYTCHTLHLLAPRLLSQERLLARLEFRKERETFSKDFRSNGKRTT
jgi:GT2 family glycosyltransferase